MIVKTKERKTMWSAYAFNETAHWIAHQLGSMIIPLSEFSHTLGTKRSLGKTVSDISKFRMKVNI